MNNRHLPPNSQNGIYGRPMQRPQGQESEAAKYIGEVARESSLRSKFWMLACAAAFVGGTALTLVVSDTGKSTQAQAEEHGKEASGHGEAKSEAKAEAKHDAKPETKAEAAHETHDAATQAAKPTSRYAASNCLADASAIEDMKHRKEDLDVRLKALESREAELKARERALTEELSKLQAVRDEISAVEGAKKKENEEKLSKLVETLETMSPKSASQMIVALDEKLAVTAMERMSTAKLAKVMNLIEPAKASRLSELLTGVARVKKPSASQNGAAVAITQSAKGGDKENGHHENTIHANGGNEAQREPANEKGSR